MTRAEAPLAVHLARLEGFVRKVRPQLTWDRIALVLEPLPGPATDFTSNRADPDEFEPLWRTIAARSARDWINLVAVGVEHDVLVVAVEYFPAGTGGRSPFEPFQVSVNLSVAARE